MPAYLSSFPTFFGLAPLPASPEARPPQRRRPVPPRPPRSRQHLPKIAPELWPVIAARAASESLRDLACAYDVSHETIRSIVRRAGPAHDLAATD